MRSRLPSTCGPPGLPAQIGALPPLGQPRAPARDGQPRSRRRAPGSASVGATKSAPQAESVARVVAARRDGEDGQPTWRAPRRPAACPRRRAPRARRARRPSRADARPGRRRRGARAPRRRGRTRRSRRPPTRRTRRVRRARASRAPRRRGSRCRARRRAARGQLREERLDAGQHRVPRAGDLVARGARGSARGPRRRRPRRRGGRGARRPRGR